MDIQRWALPVWVGTLVPNKSCARRNISHPPKSNFGQSALRQPIQFLQWIRSLRRHYIPRSRSNVEQRKEVETESGVQAAGGSGNTLPYYERLTIHRLSRA